MKKTLFFPKMSPRVQSLRSIFFDKPLIIIILIACCAILGLLGYAIHKKDQWIEYNALRYAYWYTQSLSEQKIYPHPSLLPHHLRKKQNQQLSSSFGFISPTTLSHQWSEGKLAFYFDSLPTSTGEGGMKLYSPYPFTHNKISALASSSLSQSQLDQLEAQNNSTDRRPNHLTLPDKFAQTAWQTLNTNPNQPFYQFESKKNQRWLHYAIAQVMQPRCLNCHNTHPQSPKQDWQVNDIAGVFELNFLIDKTIISQGLRDMIWLMIGIATLGFIGLIFILARLHQTYQTSYTLNRQLLRVNQNLEKQKAALLTHQVELKVTQAKAEHTHHELQNYAQDLEGMQKATLNLLQDMEIAKQEADAANRSKNEFLANMSHEIRTPMNGIMGMLSLTLNTHLTSQQREYLEIADQSSDMLLTLINDILDFSKIEMGQMVLESIDFELRKAVEEVIEWLADRALEKNVSLGILFSAHLPYFVNGDPTRYRQILSNLISNAIKFTTEGEVIIWVELVEQTDNIVIRCEISDTGIGIAQADQDRIFETFAQVDGSTTRQYGGTGLGLAVSKQLVECMGGQIGVQSTPGKGSTFWFIIPFNLPLEKPLELKPCSNLSGLRALIVDDNPTNRAVLEHNFAAWHIEYHHCNESQQALAQLREAVNHDNPFHFAIIDIMMEQKDGLNLSYAIKTDPLIAPTRLIMLSSHAQRGDAQAARQVGFSAYLTKPIRQSKLYDTITLVMGLKSEQQDVLITRHTIEEFKRQKNNPILLVEDNPFNQKVAIGILKRFGIRVDIAHNGQEAVDALQHHTYDLIFMDCQMPIMDGYQATAEIRRLEPENQRIPIIAMTANAMEGDRERCLAAQMDDYMTKPFKVEVLKKMLEKWLVSQ